MAAGYLAATPDLGAGTGELRTAETHWADTDPGLDYADDPDLDYPGDTGQDAGDAYRDHPGTEDWNGAIAQDESWDAVPGGAAGPGQDRDAGSGRTDVAGLDQLWGIGRGAVGGQEQVPGAGLDDAGAPHRSTGPSGTGPSGTGPSGTGNGGTGNGGEHGSAADSGLGSAWGAGPGAAPGPGPARNADHLPGAGQGPARDASSALNAGAPRTTAAPAGSGPASNTPAGTAPASTAPASTAPAGSAPAGSAPVGTTRAARRGLPGDFGPDPLGVAGGGATGDFRAAPTGSSILTAAPRQDSRTAHPAVASETIAAELAGWAAGELPGQASARLAAWAAIGGVPAPGYSSTDGSDVGAAGVSSERVR